MQQLKRRSNWPEALDAFIASRRERPFRYGPNDCARFAAGAVEAQTGVNLMAGMRYASKAGADRLIESEGGLLAALRARLPLIPPAQAGRGDVGLVDFDGADASAPAVCVVLADRLAAVGAQGLVFLPRSRLRAAFKV